MERFQQNFNLAGIRQFMDIIIGNQRLAIPHITVKRLDIVDWKRLRSAGVKGCVFDKDNTLTRPFKQGLDPIVEASLTSCKQIFGSSIVLFSNSAGLLQFDPHGKEAEKLEKELGISVLRHSEKKPAGGVKELEQFFNCKSEHLVMIGDRLLTDVVFGNLNGMFTIYVEPLEPGSEPFGVRIARNVENRLWSKWKQEKTQPPEHSCNAKLAEMET